MEIDKIKEVVAYLETNPKIEYNPYPQYDKCIDEFLYSLETELDYFDSHDEIIDKPIEEMSIDDLKVMYTFILRGERFSLGYIASCIEDGTILRLAKRHLELLSNNED